ncbi:hypothetical protein JCM6882_000894 [Rhodosporidiobolus microsporus]
MHPLLLLSLLSLTSFLTSSSSLFVAAQTDVDSFMLDSLPRNVTGEGMALALPAEQDATLAAVVLANGLSMQYGTISSSVDWQSSGVLLQGCSINANINNCYQLMLAATGQLQPGDDSPRQRIEFLSKPNAQEGQTWRYQWRYRLTPGISSGSSFSHLVQLLSRAQGGYVIALDTLNGRVVVRDSVPSRCPAAGCPSVPNSAFWGITTTHLMVVRFGAGGGITYTVRNTATNALILSYTITNQFIPADASLKTGIYRAVTATTSPGQARVGDFSFVRTA